jgi:hypothetical protein
VSVQAELQVASDEGGLTSVDHDPTVSVAEAAALLGRDRTRVYALLRSGDLVAAPGDEDRGSPIRILRATVERWLLAGGASGAPLSPRNAWALIGLASADEPFLERCLGLLERSEEVSRTRARLARDESLIELAPRLRRRATLIVRHLPRSLGEALAGDASLVRTGASAAAAYGWDELVAAQDPSWRLDVYVPEEAFSALQQALKQLDVDCSTQEETGSPSPCCCG